MKVIGLSGPPGSGKTTLSSCLNQCFKNCIVLRQGLYYKQEGQHSARKNFYDLSHLDVINFVADVNKLCNGEDVIVPNFDNHVTPQSGKKRIPYNNIIIIEGINIFRIPVLFNIFDLRIYLAPKVKNLIRQKIKRDVFQRGKTREESYAQLRHWVIPEYKNDINALKTKVEFLRTDLGIDFVMSEVKKRILYLSENGGCNESYRAFRSTRFRENNIK